MTVGQKAAISLLASTLAAAGFAALAWSGLFSVVETRFFDERVRQTVDASMRGLSATADAYHAQNTARFASILQKDYVRRSFLPNQSAQDEFDRSRELGLLTEETPGLQGIRFVDQDGKRIHFSTFPSDIVRSEPLKVVYRNYGEAGDEPFIGLSVAEGASTSLSPLAERRAFAYRFPFVDGFGVYRGTALFYVSFSGLLERLVQDGRIALGDDAIPIGDTGMLFGAPSWGGSDLVARVQAIWTSGPNAQPIAVGATEGSGGFVLFTSRGASGLVGRLVPASWFVMPDSLRWLLLASFFVTVYLAFFLVLNLRQDRLAVLATRIKRFQIELLEEYLERKGDLDLDRWRGELEAKRGETKARIRKSAGHLAKKRSDEVDALIDKSWDEIIAVMTSRGDRAGGTDLARFEALLTEALSKGSFVIGSQQTIPSSQALPVVRRMPAPQPSPAAEELEEFEEAEPLEAVEEAEELEEAEAVEEAEPLEAVEEAEELEEAEAVEEAEVLEEVEEAEAVEEAQAPQVAAEEIEELEEAEELELAEVVDEVEASEAAEEIEEVEELAAIDELQAPAIESGVDWGSRSAEALALSAGEDEDVPLIPESLGLELVEETDLADVIGYMDKGLNEDQMVPDGVPPSNDAVMMKLELASPFENLSSGTLNFAAMVDGVASSDESSDEGSVPASEAERLATEGTGSDDSTYQDAGTLEPQSVDEMLEEVEFDLFLGSLDLSGLDGYRDEEGFLELDDASFDQSLVPVAEAEYVVEEGVSEITMLSDEQREKVEELQTAESDDEEMADLEPLPDLPYTRTPTGYHRLAFVDSTVVELQAISDDAPAEALTEHGVVTDPDAARGMIALVNGVYTIDRDALAGSQPLDPELKALADAVLGGERA